MNSNLAFRLTGKTALVTGRTKGIGQVMALGLAPAASGNGHGAILPVDGGWMG